MEETVMPFLDAMAKFRDSVRQSAIETKATSVLKECDRLRDDVLPELGVRLEDKENEPTVIKLVDKKELMREKQMKKELEAAKKLEKEKKKAEAAAKQAALEAQKKIAPSEMFKAEVDKYSKFDDKVRKPKLSAKYPLLTLYFQGMPTHDAKGEEISKAQLKKLQKLFQAQEKRYNDYMKSQNEL
jgi:cysteinyl-tRNA synthetase